MTRYRLTLWVDTKDEETAKRITLYLHGMLHQYDRNPDYAEPVEETSKGHDKPLKYGVWNEGSTEDINKKP